MPQCGFSAAATNLYSTRLITLGTLIAVYLSTSDEMIPIFISEEIPITIILKILLVKFLVGVFYGFLIDLFFNKISKNKMEKEPKIESLCKDEHCHCHRRGIVKSALKHTINITIYIFIITLIINLLISIIGESTIENFIQNNLYLGPIISSLIGLIPNCAASVIITNLYIQNVINASALISGLLTGAGVGLIVLFRTNKKNIKENLSIVFMIYLIGVVTGWALQMFNFTV